MSAPAPLNPMHFPHHLPVLSVLTAGATLILAAAGSARAGPGEGITTGRLTMRPYIDTSATYDSNVSSVPVADQAQDPQASPATAGVLDEESDIYYQLRAGATFHWYYDRTAVIGDAWGNVRRYADHDADNEEGFGQRLGVARGNRETLAWRAYESYERRFDFTLQDAEAGVTASTPELPALSLPALSSSNGPNGPEALSSSSGSNGGAPVSSAGAFALEEELLLTSTRRDLFGVGLDGGRNLSDKLELDVGYSYAETDYEDPTLFGQSQHTVTAGLGRPLTHKTTAFLRGTYGLEDNDNYQDAVSDYQLLVGLRSGASAKLTYDAGIGYQRSETADTKEVIDEPTPDDNQGNFAYDAGITWRPTHKLGFSLSGRNEYDSTSAGTQREINLVQLSAGHRPTDAVSLSMGLGYRDENELDPVIQVDEAGREALIAENRENLIANARASFRPPRQWYEVYADVAYEEIQSNLAGQSYDRVRVGAGLKATY